MKEGETVSIAWQEGSGMDQNTYQATGGTGRFKGVTGGGTYKYDQLTTTLFGGRYHSKMGIALSGNIRAGADERGC